MTVFTKGLFVSSLVLLTACSTVQQKNDGAPGATGVSKDANEVGEIGSATIKENEVSSEDVEKNVEMPYKSSFGEIAMDDNEHVQKWVRYFTGKGRPHMVNYLSRSSRYLPMMKNVLRENGLPEDLVYIALIESGFSPRAHSHANAVGYWQFIRSTGKHFGLAVDTFIDERRDPVLSTRAAAEYFKALYRLLGNWHLAMAAYNVGESRVKRTVARYYTKDFWELIKKRRSLPAETKNYVPKFIAAAMIAKDPAKYGFTELDFQDPLSYDTVALQSAISISKLASNLNVEAEELRLLNPKFRTDFVPLSRGGETVVRIPVGRATDAVAALSMSVTSQPKILQAEHHFYRIRRGDNLSTIAKRHRTTVSQLRRLNGLSNRTLLRPGVRLKVPDNGGDGIQYVTEEDSRQPSTASGLVPAVETRDVEFHVVRSGDNVSVIAKRYGVSVSEILKLNTLGGRSVLHKGQKIRVRQVNPASGSDPKSTNRSSALRGRAVAAATVKRASFAIESKDGKKSRHPATGFAVRAAKRHVVKRGETLYDVSKRYGITLGQLAEANKLKISHRVMAGHRLVIP
jgi:membrane-bound lytic murein transglycosylase D